MKIYQLGVFVLFAVLAREQGIAQKRPVDRIRVVDTLPVEPPAIQPSRDTCGDRRISNAFGENPDSYTDKTVVYVYDFSQGVGRRKFYKVTLDKKKTKDNKKNTLYAVAVDLNSETLRTGGDVYLKIVNINKFLFDISIDAKPEIDKSTPGSVLTRNSLGDSMIMTAWLGTLVNDADIMKLEGSSDLRAFYSEVRRFLKQYAWACEEALKAYSPCLIAPCCDSPQADPDYFDLVKHLIHIRTRTIDIAMLLDNAKGLLKSTNASIKSAQKTHDTLNKIKNPNDDQKKQIADLTSQIDKYKDKVEKLTGIIASAASVKDLVIHLPTEADLKKLAVFKDNIIKSNLEELYPLHVGPNGLDFSMTIQSRQGVFDYFSLQPRTKLSIYQFIPVVCKTQMTFSLGPFAGFSNNLQNVTYTWQQLANNSNMVISGANYILVPSGYSHSAPGIAAMANIEWKYTGSLGLGVSGGAGLTAEQNTRLAGLAGGSIFLGNWRQVVITAGVLAIDVNRLTNNWQTVADKQVIYTSQPPLSYYKELRVGGFVSLTVTPFKLCKN